MNIQDWFPLDWLVESPYSPSDSQESSPTPQFKSINSLALSFLYSPTLTSIYDYWKAITLTRWTFVGKVISLLFNMLSTLAWKNPWMEEPGRLQSMWSLRVRHDWATSLSLFTFMYWRRKWQPTPVFLPGESQGQGSLVGFRLWGRTESDTTEVT